MVSKFALFFTVYFVVLWYLVMLCKCDLNVNVHGIKMWTNIKTYTERGGWRLKGVGWNGGGEERERERGGQRGKEREREGWRGKERGRERSYRCLFLKCLKFVNATHPIHILHGVPELWETIKMRADEVNLWLMDAVKGARAMTAGNATVQQRFQASFALIVVARTDEVSLCAVIIFCSEGHARRQAWVWHSLVLPAGSDHKSKEWNKSQC